MFNQMSLVDGDAGEWFGMVSTRLDKDRRKIGPWVPQGDNYGGAPYVRAA
jgi:hypothetical protein